MVLITNIYRKEVKAMVTVFRILFGKMRKLEMFWRAKGVVCPFKPNNHTKSVIGAFSLWQINYNSMT